jgi:orotidine-5'-phosphate decarboxylase
LKNAKDKLIVALDVDSAARAFDLFDSLRDVGGMFKIGSQLFTAAGPDIVRKIVAKGGRVFLDLKFHDIPNTVAAASIEAARLGVSIFNVHASGGTEMMTRAAEAVAATAKREGVPKPKVIAVTLLTSLDSAALRQIGISGDAETSVANLARAAATCGLDGVVASAHEIQIIRAAVPNPEFIIVTPGIRPGSPGTDDQRRVMTAAGAIRAGADYLVVGRPILNADDPIAAANSIVAEIEGGFPS